MSPNNVNNNDWNAWSVYMKKTVEKHDKKIEELEKNVLIMKMKWSFFAGIIGLCAGLLPTIFKLIFGG